MDRGKVRIDTNILLRAIVDENTEKSKEAQEILKEISKGWIIAHIDVECIFECIFVLTSYYKNDTAKTIEMMKAIINMPNIVLDADKLVLTTSFTIKMENDKKIGFIDAYLISKSLDDGIKLISFDKKLMKVYDEMRYKYGYL